MAAIDPEKVGVWVPVYIAEMCPTGTAGLMLAQLSWLLQSDRSGLDRTKVMDAEDDGGRWLARADIDWVDDTGLDRSEAFRSRTALLKAGLIEVQSHRRPVWLRPVKAQMISARKRALEQMAASRGTARPSARNRAMDSAEARDATVLIKNRPRTEELNPLFADAQIEHAPAVIVPGLFDAFWNVYPRHEKKPDAAKAWAKAVNRAPAETILAGARRYREDPNREPLYTAHPASWLNGDCWADDPLPPRRANGNGQGSQSMAERQIINHLRGGQ